MSMKWDILMIVICGIFLFAYVDVVRDYNELVGKCNNVSDKYDNLVDDYNKAIDNNYNITVNWILSERHYVDSEKKQNLSVLKIESLEESNAILKAKIDRLNEFSLDMNPSIFEVRDFLALDSTDTNTWVEDTYDCTQFSFEVVRNALSNGLFACTVEMDIGDGGHILVAFNTSERGVVYFEPQTDKEVTLRIGKKYWSSNNHDAVIYNDTIERWDSCFE